ncbi:MAG: serine/threonine protein kinase, partial [Eggerthellaceae bacterium]|nr:serine/threonine protein kinase [Eggerthellaceae bacterium]
MQSTDKPQMILERYRYIDDAGFGGYAKVIHAYDSRLNRDVAIKCIKLSQSELARAHLLKTEQDMNATAGAAPSGQPDEDGGPPWLEGPGSYTLEMTDEGHDPFRSIPGLEEARTTAHLSNPHIVTVYDCVVEGDTVYIIMEYIEGMPLSLLLDELGDDISFDMISSVFSAVAEGLKAAHKVKILHLDIKPDNVIIKGDGTVKVTDFGLAALMDGAGQATTGGWTIGYMP